MSDEANTCPFCGEPRVFHGPNADRFRCGTHVATDENGEYTTGHTCDLATFGRVIRDKEAEIERLRAELVERTRERDEALADIEELRESKKPTLLARLVNGWYREDGD